MQDRSHALGATDALLLLMAAIWGVNYSAVKYGSRLLTPLTFTWARVLLAMLTLAAVALWQRRARPASRDVLALLGLGVLGNGVYQLCFVFGVSRTRVADAVLIVAAAPAFIAIISRVRGVERVRRRSLAGIALTIVGVGIVMLGSATAARAGGTLLGTALVFTGVLCWAAFTVGIQPLTHRVDPVQLNAVTMAGGMVPLLLLTPFALASPAIARAPVAAWGCLVYSSIVSLGVAYLIWYRGIRVLGPTRTSVYANLQPIVAIAVGWMVLAERPTAWQVVGTATILGGIFLTRLSGGGRQLAVPARPASDS